MTEEIKIRIDDPEAVKERLERLGGEFDRELSVRDTYFDTSPDRVLKVTEDDSGDYLVELREEEGKFQIERYEEIEDPEEVREELGEKHGVKCVLDKKRVFYEFDDFVVNLNLIEGVGDFLIVECENPSKEIVEGRLEFEDPEYITVPFSELVGST